MQLCETTNTITGKKRYYADGVRISKEAYEFYEICYKRWDTLYITSTDTLLRSFKSVSHWNR